MQPAPAGRVCRSYVELTDAIALRLVELNVQQLELDHRCGLATGHSGKLLAPEPIKLYGKLSLGLHLQVLGLVLIVAPDPERPPVLANTRQFKPRNPDAVMAGRQRLRQVREEQRAAVRAEREAARRRLLARWRRVPDESPSRARKPLFIEVSATAPVR
jgi:hypothetical protein